MTRALRNGLTLVLKIRVLLPLICTISFSFIATSLQSNKHVVIIPTYPKVLRGRHPKSEIDETDAREPSTMHRQSIPRWHNCVKSLSITRRSTTAESGLIAVAYVEPFYFPGGKIIEPRRFEGGYRSLFLRENRTASDTVNVT